MLEREPGADGMGRKLSRLLLGFLATEVVPLAERLAELGIDPTPLFATASGTLRLYADTLSVPTTGDVPTRPSRPLRLASLPCGVT
jgi:hypothetical protein